MRTLSVLSEKRRYEYTTIRTSSSRKCAVVHTVRLRTICAALVAVDGSRVVLEMAPVRSVCMRKSRRTTAPARFEIKLRTSCERRSEPMNEEINRFAEWPVWSRDYHDVVRVVSVKRLPARTIRLQHQFERTSRASSSEVLAKFCEYEDQCDQGYPCFARSRASIADEPLSLSVHSRASKLPRASARNLVQ